MRAAAPERDVFVGRPGDVEAIRVREHRLVAVRGDVPEDDLVAVAHGLPTQLGVAHRRPAEAHDRRRPPQHLLDCGRQQGAIGAYALELIRVLEERNHAVGDQVAGRLVAGDRQQEEEEVELEVAQPLAFDLGVDEDAHQVLRRFGAPLRREL